MSKRSAGAGTRESPDARKLRRYLGTLRSYGSCVEKPFACHLERSIRPSVLSLFRVATEAQVRGHMCWSGAFDPFRGSTVRSSSVPGGRTDRSREPSWARAVRRLGVPVGTGGKANCLCLRGIWETPKRRYREETKPVVKLPGTTFCAKDPARHARSWRRDTAARKPRGRAPSEETHLRREARASFARFSAPRCEVGRRRNRPKCRLPQLAIPS
jgi:hypothetical protein